MKDIDGHHCNESEKTGEVNKITNVHCIVFLILTVFPEHTLLKKSSNEYFSDPLIPTKTPTEKFARR